MSEKSSAGDAPRHVSAASEERFIATAEELTSESSRTTLFAINVLQSLLVASVILWVLDIPRQVFGVAFYTEQLLTVCLGLTLALAYVTETARKPTRLDPSGVIAFLIICIYIAYRYRSPADIPLALYGGLLLTAVWALVAGRPWAARTCDWIACIASLALCGYIAVRYEALTYELAMLPIEGIIGSAILVFLVLDGSRRTSGFGFVGIILALAVYVYISPNLPGDFQTRWVSPERLVAYLGLDVNSIIGSILQVAVIVVIPFTIMAQVIARCGGANFFSDIAMALMGNLRGGAAKISIMASALFGTITGSAVSNVLAVGIVTIPTMIKSGFSPRRAAAIESVASTNAQLSPPVMGAAAFIMAEFLQVSYGAVCIAATIPTLLYYGALYLHVDLEAAKHNIGTAKLENILPVRTVMKSGWHFLVPIAFLVYSLIYPEHTRLTPEKTAIVCTLMIMVLAYIFGYRGERPTIRGLLMAIIETGRVSLDIILIGAAAGIMVGILAISGLAFSLTLQLLALSGENVFALLVLIAVLAFVLGIGLPTVSVYILTATLLAPALVKLGVTPMAAHMFVMYNGMLSMITPPVAFAAYAAANIARTDGWTTGWIACLVGWSTFIVPFLFVLTPSLLMDGPTYLIAWNLVRVMFGLFVGTAAIVGFALTPLPVTMRFVYGIISLPIVLPPEAVTGGHTINFIGIAAGIALLVFDHLRRKKAAATTAPA